MKFQNLKFQFRSLLVILLLNFTICAQTYNDATLASVRLKDAASRDASGKLQPLTASEHAYRADVYSSNRAFSSAREHWQKILDNYPTDPAVPKALFGIGRSFMWEKNYSFAVQYFDRLIRDYIATKEGREGLAFKGASLVRLNKPLEAAKVYEQYTVMFPAGERAESSYLNVIDAYREAGKTSDAYVWVSKTRARFPRTATETNAVFAKLRLEINQKNWKQAAATADELRALTFAKGAMTNVSEINFLKAYVLEKQGRRDEAINAYFAVPDGLGSYYGALATERLQELVKLDNSRRAELSNRQARLAASALGAASQYPASFRNDLLKSALPRKVDPRFVLAIMKQESGFRAEAKSPAAARGLLQLTVDTAAKYTQQAKITNLQPEDLYRPSVSIALGSIYLAELQQEFGGLSEAVAASYNGGEENAARWLRRADSKEPFVFAAEVGFAETKDYVFKVMSNYRVYRELYTEDLRRK